MTTIGRPDALAGSERGDTTVDRVPLVMTYHPFNTHIKRYLLQNFRILSTDQQTRDIFPQPPIVAYKRDLSLRDILVHSTDSSSTEQPGSHVCQRPRCQTCEFVTPLTDIRGPKSTFTIRDHFTCMLENLVYCISCRRCSHIYIGETGRNLRSRISEHLRSGRNNTPGFPVAQHFNSAVTVLQMSRCEVCVCVEVRTSVPKQLEMRLIFQQGTVQRDGLNINFKYV